jgi:hypothetical protein
LLDTTEKFCKDRAVHNAVLSGIKILDKKDKEKHQRLYQELLSEALAVHLIIILDTIILMTLK